MKKSRWTIYCHTHRATDRRYVGLTKMTMMERWNRHAYNAKSSKGGWSPLANAIQKYGKDAFDHEVLKVHDTLEEANAAEERWISHFDSRNPEKGFNLEKVSRRLREGSKARLSESELQDKRWTIYCHIHKETGRRYVGMTSRSWRKRWNDHVCAAQFSKGGRWHFPNAIRKYGKDAFDHEVLEVCYSLEDANAAEIKWISRFDSRNPEKGFNLAKGGTHVPHPIKNPWDRPEFRAARLADLARANAGLTHTQRSSMSKKLWQDPDFRKKVVPVLQSNMKDPEIKDRAVSAMRESFARPESKEKRSRSSKAMWESDEYRIRNAELWKDPDFRDRCETGLLHGASLNREKTHCRHGHEYTPQNTYVNRRGSRECRVCSRKRGRVSARAAYWRNKDVSGYQS